MILRAAIAVLISLAAVSFAIPQEAMPRLVCCGAEEVFVLAPEQGGGEGRKVWSWRATDSPEIPADARAWFRSTDECKVYPDQLLITSSSDGVALVRRSDKRCLFLARARNAHSACLLPGGRLAVAASMGGDALLIYSRETTQWPAMPLAEIALSGAHGAHWDAQRECLWALGDQALLRIALEGSGKTTRLRVDGRWPLPSRGGHDLTPSRDGRTLHVTTESQVLCFHPPSESFALDPALGDLGRVKSIAAHPVVEPVAYVRGEQSWWSDTIRFAGSHRTLRLPGERLYKVRWDRPCDDPDAAPDRPNVVILFADDLGWADLGCYGAKDIATPQLDRMAAGGMRFTDFYAAPVCTPSRAALLTGCHPMRLGLGHRVIFPYMQTGLHPEELTLAELLQARGYATGCFGKWHLGHYPPFLPTSQGFDEFEGTPYSNDMNAHHYKRIDYRSPPLPWMRGEELVEENPDQAQLTARTATLAIDYIARHRGQPFFLYVPFNMPHKPIHASEGFRGRSRAGLYGDVIEELDDAVGRILDALAEHGIDERTLVFFSSDNGPWRRASAGPLRGRKGTTWEGGMRVPLLARWPGRIPAASTCSELASTMDLLPTIAALTGAPPPLERVVDGADIRPLLLGESGARSPHAFFPYYRDNRLEAVRSGRWKLHVHRPQGKGEPRGPLLYDLESDLGEQRDVAAEHPEVVARLAEGAEAYRADLGDAVEERAGAGVRPVGRLPNLVVLMADDLGAAELGCYGHPEHATPHLDQLAAGGMRFRTCWSTPLCSPTRVEIMSGRYGFRTGWYNFRGRPGSPTHADRDYVLAEHERSFAQVLSTAGYATALAGKWQLGGRPPGLVHELGFDEYLIWAYTHNLPAGVEHSGGWQGKKGGTTSRFWHPCLLRNGEYLPTQASQYGPDLFADFALDFARRHRKRPFLIYYPMCLTHTPWVRPPDPQARDGKGARGLRSNVETMDRIVGRIVAGLEELGLREDTIVIFTGDNGTQGAGKTETAERGVRVPLIVNGPAGLVASGVVSDELVDLSDILPTLADLAHASLPAGRIIDGVSLAPTLRDPAARHREWIFSYLHEERLLRDRRWLLEGDGRFFDCGASRDGEGYRDVTDSDDPEVQEARRRFDAILSALPAPAGLPPCPVLERKRRAKK